MCRNEMMNECNAEQMPFKITHSIHRLKSSHVLAMHHTYLEGPEVHPSIVVKFSRHLNDSDSKSLRPN